MSKIDNNDYEYGDWENRPTPEEWEESDGG